MNAFKHYTYISQYYLYLIFILYFIFFNKIVTLVIAFFIESVSELNTSKASSEKPVICSFIKAHKNLRADASRKMQVVEGFFLLVNFVFVFRKIIKK